jgi:hypothetical protein
MIGLFLAAIAYARAFVVFPAPARGGDGRSPSTTRRFQKKTTAAFTGQHRPTLLGYAPAMVVRLGWCLDHRTAPNSGCPGVCAPGRLGGPRSMTRSGDSSAE